MVPAENEAVVVLVNGGSGLGFRESAPLLDGITATALGLDDDGHGSRIWQKAFFVSLVALPAVYLLSMVWAWRHRTAIRAKSTAGFSGRFSLWFPLLTTLLAAWAIFALVPTVGGAPVGTILLFSPDFGAALVATAVTGVAWATFRLVVAYTGRPAPAPSTPA